MSNTRSIALSAKIKLNDIGLRKYPSQGERRNSFFKKLKFQNYSALVSGFDSKGTRYIAFIWHYSHFR